MLIPIAGAGALAIDYGRASSVRSKLQLAADAAVLAAKGDPASNRQQSEAIARRFMAENSDGILGAEIISVNIAATGDQIDLDVRAKLGTSLGALFGKDYIDVGVRSRAVASTDDLELALVLDNTGSMRDHMDELRTGANDLVRTLFDSAGSRTQLKIAVVPYVGAVNIGNGPLQMTWMDTAADSRLHAEAIEWRYFGYELGCTYAPGGGGSDPGSGTHGFLWELMPRFADAAASLIGVSSAQAATAGDVPAPFQFAPDCWLATPAKLNHFDFFAQIPNTEWKGCVEARPEPFDVTDDPPNPANADTLFVPWFWPDETDNAALAAMGDAMRTVNDYLPDRLDLRDAVAPVFNDPNPHWGMHNILKYNGTPAIISETGPATQGPNRACPDPILPLSDVRDDIRASIDGLMHWDGSGTNIAEGLVWGWRVLSPNAPFTQGAPYGRANKVIVLMTDGVNNVNPVPLFGHLSEYSAYGYLEQWSSNRIADKTYQGFKDYADGRLSEVCTNAKNAGVQIYTVAFGITDDDTLALLRDCATAPPYAYTATTSGDLIQAFQQVATSLSKLRLAK